MRFLISSFLRVVCFSLFCTVLHPLVRLSLGIPLHNGKVFIERISKLEWNQATKHTLRIDDVVALQPLQLMNTRGSFRRPLIVLLLF